MASRDTMISKWESHEGFLNIPVIQPDDEILIEVLDNTGTVIGSLKPELLSTENINTECPGVNG